MTISRDQFIVWIKDFAGVIAENKEYLTELDSAIGDADHGINMNRGFQAVLTKLPAFENQDIGSIAKNIGMVLISTVGGASGPERDSAGDNRTVTTPSATKNAASV